MNESTLYGDAFKKTNKEMNLKQECIPSKAHRLIRDRNPNTYNMILE